MTSSEIALINKENLDKPEGKSEQVNCDTVAEVNEEVDFENTKTQLEEQNEALKNLLNNVNYGIILSFFDKFSIHLGLSKEITIFKNLESSLTNKKILHRKLIDFHINLLKNLHCGRHVKKDKWEYYLAKYVGKYALDESLYIEQNGYLSLDIDLKLSIIKNLLESQFDENMKFKQILAEQITDLNSLRSVTIGRDKDGVLYWFFMDKEYSIRMFSQNYNDNDCKSWKLIVKELSELKELIQKLSTEPSLITLRSSKRYLANIDKEKKLKEKKLKEEEALNEELNNKEIKNEELCEEEKIEKSLDEIKKEDESNDTKEKAESPSESIDSPSVKSENDSKDITDVNSKSEEDSNDIKIKLKEENESSISQIEIEKNDCNDNDLLFKTEDLNKTVINKETKMKEENSLDETVNTKNTKLTVEENFDDYIEPIALRKSTRASAIKAQEIQQLQLRTPIKSPKKSSPLKKKSEPTKKDLEPENIVDEDDIEEEERNVRKSRRKKNTDEDQEFKPKVSKTPTKRNQAEENENKKLKSKKKKKQETESEEGEDEEDPNFDSSCIKCSKVKRNQILILCDGCDAAYHLICLKMDEVPDGDWFCTICEHDKLIKALEEKTELIENHFKEIELAKTKSIVKRTNRIADIGANLDNLFKNGTKKRNRTKDEENNDPNDEDESEDNSFRKRPRRPFEDFNKPVSNYFTNTEPVGPRSCRVKGKISYTFEDYDRTIKEAVGENVEQPKDSSMKIRSSKRTKSKVKKPKVYEDDDTEYEDEDEANSENEEDKNSSNASSSSEFKVKTKKKDFSESEEDCDDEKKFSDDDDDFRPSKSKKKIEHKNRRCKKAKKTSKIRTKRAKEDYDDEDDGVEDEDDDEESDEDVSDEEESFRREVKKNKQLYSYERRSARNRKCLKESYCELDEDEEYEKKKKTKFKKIKDSEDDFSDELSEEDLPKKNKFNSTRRSNRAKKGNKKYNDDFDVYDDNDDDYKSYYEDDNDDEKSLNTNHRNNSETKKNKSRIKKLWSDDENEDENSDSDGEKEKRSKKQVIIKPWEEDDEDEDEEDEENEEEEEEGEEEEKDEVKEEKKEDKKEKEKKEEKEEKIEKEEKKVTQIIKDEKELEKDNTEIEKAKEAIKDLKNENDKNKKSNGDTIYSSSSSYSSSGSSTRSTSPVQHDAQPVNNKIIDKNDSLIDRLNKATNILNDVIKPKITNDNSINLNNEVLLKPTNFSSEMIVEKLVENKIEKTNNDSSSHSDVVKTSAKKKNKKLEEPNEIPKITNESNKTTISNDSNANNRLLNSQNPLQPATVVYSPSQFVNMQSKTIQPLNSQSQVPFQLYNQADVNQKTQIINQTLPLNSFATINNFGNVNYSQPGYPQLYYYYQQQQQQFNNQQAQPMMIQNPGTIITPNSIIPQTQPITFLQSYNNNSVAFNSQTSTNNLLPNYVTQPGYPIQPGTNLFQPHLINFSGGSAVNINMNGVSSLNQSSHQS